LEYCYSEASRPCGASLVTLELPQFLAAQWCFNTSGAQRVSSRL